MLVDQGLKLVQDWERLHPGEGLCVGVCVRAWRGDSAAGQTDLI